MANRSQTEVCSREVGRAVMRRACAKHGVPAKIDDPAVLAKVAAMVLEVLDRTGRRGRSAEIPK